MPSKIRILNNQMVDYCCIQNRGETMFNKIGMLLCMMMLVATSAFAHVTNETNLFEDLSLSEASNEIVLLSALGVVSSQDGKQTFRPQDTLTAKDLAAWLGSFYGLEGTTSAELAQAASAKGLLSTIDGDATYSLVNEAFFQGALQVENPDEQMTREQFAKFVASHVHRKIDEHTLMDKVGFTPGPTGVIEKVERVAKNMPTGGTANIYQITISGEVYEIGMHPRTIADAADPLVWQGLTIAESWYGPNFATDVAGAHSHHEGDDSHNDHSSEERQAEVSVSEDVVASTALQFIVIGDTPVTAPLQDEETVHVAEQTHQSEATAELDEQLSSVTVQQKSVEVVSTSSTSVLGFVGIGIVVIGVLLALGMHRRRNSLK